MIELVTNKAGTTGCPGEEAKGRRVRYQADLTNGLHPININKLFEQIHCHLGTCQPQTFVKLIFQVRNMDHLGTCHPTVIAIQEAHQLNARSLRLVDHFCTIHYLPIFLLQKLQHNVPTIWAEDLTNIIRCIIRGQEHCRRYNLTHFAEASNRQLCQFRRFPFLCLGRQQICENRSWRYSVDEYIPGCNLTSQRFRKGDHPTFTGTLVCYLDASYVTKL